MTEGRSVGPWTVVAVSAVGLLAATAWGPEPAAVAGLLVVGPGVARTLRGLVGAIGVGAAVVGAIAGVAAAVAGGPLTPIVAAGVGVAVGGGVGSAVWLFAAGDDAEDASADVTVDVGETAPAPQPADLFEANPDPILFVGGPEAVVLAANPAFGDVFGVDPADLEGRPLAESLPVETGDSDVVEAASTGRSFEDRVRCETADGPATVRVRFVPTGGSHGAGYVVYGPFDEEA